MFFLPFSFQDTHAEHVDKLSASPDMLPLATFLYEPTEKVRLWPYSNYTSELTISCRVL